MIFKTKKFGTVEIDENNGFYDRINISMAHQGVVNCGLNVCESITKDPAHAEKASKLVDSLDELDRKAREAVKKDYDGNNNGTVGYYLRFHLNELDSEFWEATFPGVAEIDELFVLSHLKLNSVGLHTEDGAVHVNLDYVINFDFSDELIAVYFDEDGEIIAVSHES